MVVHLCIYYELVIFIFIKIEIWTLPVLQNCVASNGASFLLALLLLPLFHLGMSKVVISCGCQFLHCHCFFLFVWVFLGLFLWLFVPKLEKSKRRRVKWDN